MIKSIKQYSIQLRRQKGAALILLFLAILMTGTVVFVTSISMNRSRIQSDAQTMQSLAKAKEALIAFAASYYQRGNAGIYGILPCVEDTNPPSTTNREGNESFNCENITRYTNDIGRLPWNTLGIGPVKDSSGECLWYAVSGEYLNAGTALSQMHNEDSLGMFEVYDENGIQMWGSLPEDRVVAVIIAPGAELAGQNRPAVDPDMPCNINRITASQNISDFLDDFGGINNSDVSTTINTIDQFIASLNTNNPGINDIIKTITVGEIFTAIRRQNNYAANMATLVQTHLAGCLRDYRDLAANTNRLLPWAAPFDLNGADYRVTASYSDASDNLVGRFGRFPFDINDSHVGIIPSPYLGNIFSHCIAPVVGAGNDMQDIDLTFEFRRLYEHWKDHIFYAVSVDYLPGGTGNCIPVTNCITYQVSGTNIPVIAIIFDGRERQNQLRRAEPPANPVNDASSKAIMTNYLESGVYPTFISTGNDFAACIDLNNSVCQCDGLVPGTGLCPP